MSANPCQAHGCSLCCHDTEMALAQEDVARLEKLGHARDAFSVVDADGFRLLRNVDGACFFLKGGACSVYADRPLGCRSYPIVLTPDLRVVRDLDCPWRQEFPVQPAAQRRLVKLFSQMQREARARRP